MTLNSLVENEPSVSIVLPVFNEENIVQRSTEHVARFLSSLPHPDWNLVIADNGSTDKTRERGQELAAMMHRVSYLRTERKGVGAALRMAWVSSLSDVLGYVDADLPFRLETFDAMWRALQEGYDIATGSRYVEGGGYETTWLRKVLSRLHSYWMQLLFGCKFSDHCGIKAIKRQVFLDLLPFLRSDDWFFGTELLVWAERFGYRIKEVPVQARNDRSRRSKVNLPLVTINYIRCELRLKILLVRMNHGTLIASPLG